MSELLAAGIPSNPIQFEGNRLLPPSAGAAIDDPQNLWLTIENAQRWNRFNILGLHETGQPIPIIAPYKEQPDETKVHELIEDADTRRTGDETYTDQRNHESLGVLLGLREENFDGVRAEFSRKSVLDIGSGSGAFGTAIRSESGAKVVELDFSLGALKGKTPIPEGQGGKLNGDGTSLPVVDAAFDRTISMFSTSVHANTARSRLRGLTEALRVTRPGGRVFVVPLLGDMILRQQRWFGMQNRKQEPGFWNEDMQNYEDILRREAAIDHALVAAMSELMLSQTITLTPVLVRQKRDGEIHDCISGIFDVNETLTTPRAQSLIDAAVAPFC